MKHRILLLCNCLLLLPCRSTQVGSQDLLGESASSEMIIAGKKIEQSLHFIGKRKMLRIVGSPTFYDIYVSDSDLKKISSIKEINEIRLENVYIEEPGIKHLAGMDNIESVSLIRTNLTDIGLQHVLKLKNLKFLDVSQTRLSKKSLEEISDCKNLKIIRMKGTRFKIDDLRELEEKNKGLKAHWY